MKNEWHQTLTFSCEVECRDGSCFDLDAGKECAILAPFVGSRTDLELIVQFTSDGYYTPMSMYGGPDHLGWPAEGADDRELAEAWLQSKEGKHCLPVEVQEAIFKLYLDEIMAVALEPNEEPDPDENPRDPYQEMIDGADRADRLFDEQEYWDAVNEKYGLDAAMDRSDMARKRELGE